MRSFWRIPHHLSTYRITNSTLQRFSNIICQFLRWFDWCLQLKKIMGSKRGWSVASEQENSHFHTSLTIVTGNIQTRWSINATVWLQYEVDVSSSPLPDGTGNRRCSVPWMWKTVVRLHKDIGKWIPNSCPCNTIETKTMETLSWKCWIKPVIPFGGIAVQGTMSELKKFLL